jgi:uncharacterized damage-inducible protein DinB
MTETKRIADQLRRANGGDAWHGPSLGEVLAGVTAAQAAARPVSNAHSIWEIVLHVAAWEGAVRARIVEGSIAQPAEGDWPAVTDTSEAVWQRALALLEERHAALIEAVGRLDDAELSRRLGEERDKPLGGGVSIYGTLHGVIQHNLYHAGQIALLRNALGK